MSNGEPKEEDIFKILNYDCISIIFYHLAPIDLVRCSLASRALREWSHAFMINDGLRGHFPYCTDTGCPNDDDDSPVERYTRFAKFQHSVHKGTPSSVFTLRCAQQLRLRGSFAAWITSGTRIRYHRLRNEPGEEVHRSQVQPIRTLEIRRHLPPSSSFSAQSLKLNAEGYLLVSGVVTRSRPVRAEFHRDIIFTLAGPKKLWHMDRDADAFPELRPLHIGKERVYYMTKSAPRKLVAYDLKTGRQLYQSTVPVLDETSRFIADNHTHNHNHEFIVSLRWDHITSPPTHCITLISGATGQVTQEVRSNGTLCKFSFQEHPTLAAFALRAEPPRRSYDGEIYDLILYEKYRLQTNGQFAVSGTDAFVIKDRKPIAGPARVFIDPFRRLGFVAPDTPILPDVLEINPLSDPDKPAAASLPSLRDGASPKIDNWFSIVGKKHLLLPPPPRQKDARSGPKTKTDDVWWDPGEVYDYEVSFWEERGFVLSGDSRYPGPSVTYYALDFTPRPDHSNPGVYGLFR